MALRLVHGVEQAAQHLLHKVRQGHPNESECEMSDITWTAILAVTNLLMLWIGFYLGDEAHHEVEEIDMEQEWRKHVDSACWVARP